MFIQGIVYYVFGIVGFTNGIIDSFKYINKNDDETDKRHEYLKRTCSLLKYRRTNPITIYIISGTIYSLTYLSIPFLSNRIIDHFIKG